MKENVTIAFHKVTLIIRFFKLIFMQEVKNIIAQIKSKKYLPVYLLTGEEPYYIDKITQALVDNVLSEDEKSFNLDIVYGKDTDVMRIIATARQFPLMADYRLVVVKEAQEIKDFDEFSSYLKQIQEQTVVVINYKYKKLDKRKALYKAAKDHKQVFYLESDKIKEHKVAAVISQLIVEKNRKIDQKALAMLVEYLGNDLSKIENEIGKLCILIPEGEMITDAIIEKNIGISKDYNNFELIKAIASKDRAKAFRIAQYFSENPQKNPAGLTIGILYNFFSMVLQYHGVLHKNKHYKVNDVAKVLGKPSFMLNDAELAVRYYSMKDTSRNINYLKDLDLKVKGVEASNVAYHDLLIEFLGKIFL